MPTYPEVPIPHNVSLFSYVEQTAQQTYDKGYTHTRSLYSRALRTWSFEYLGLNYTTLMLLMNFMQEIRGGSTLFALNMPYGPTLSNVTGATPIVVTTAQRHNFKSGDRIRLLNVAGVTGVGTPRVISITSNTTFTMLDSVGTGTFVNDGLAMATLQFLRVQITNADGVFNAITKLLGPDYDEYGIRHITIEFSEHY